MNCEAMELRKNVEKALFPLLRGGVAAPIKQMERYVKEIGAAGEVKPLLPQDSDLPAAPFFR